MIKILNIVGARPNFIKIAPLVQVMNQYPQEIIHLLVHTGQHYDIRMSKMFFDDLSIPRPDIDLGVGSGSHAEQTGKVMIEFENICLQEKPDLVLVVGDVNSTMACTITAKKLGIRVAHVEAGLRSGDMSMPEEINRLCTDVLCDFLFTTDLLANKNLEREGRDPKQIYFVGNVMIDTLLEHKQMAEKLDLIKRWNLLPGQYATLTVHRPSNVDDREVLEEILTALYEISKKMPIIFPIHPRTRKMLAHFDLDHYLSKEFKRSGIIGVDPLGYLEFLHLNLYAKMVITDSGGLQEETTVLGVPCLTLRNNTERPITCSVGTNQLVGNGKKAILDAAEKILAGDVKSGRVPEKWDGKAAKRIVEILINKLSCRRGLRAVY
ncbi:MAG: UDP-N-acetylglucosamine 2-epimerase (non-hydrolyzing) [Desulfobacterales bacterium]